jgi:hypothetical protein
MIVEPKTSPRDKYPWQVIYGAIAALLMAVLFKFGISYAEFWGILGANLFAAFYPVLMTKFVQPQKA